MKLFLPTLPISHFYRSSLPSPDSHRIKPPGNTIPLEFHPPVPRVVAHSPNLFVLLVLNVQKLEQRYKENRLPCTMDSQLVSYFRNTLYVIVILLHLSFASRLNARARARYLKSISASPLREADDLKVSLSSEFRASRCHILVAS